jgi:histo-blood group ABO system transferase
MATGRYIEFVEPLLKSADSFFLIDHEVTYFVFTDGKIDFADRIARPIVRIEQKRVGWPYDTLMRLPIYASHADYYKDMDYLYAIDADMLFVDHVGDEILGERVGALHLAFIGRRGTYETNAQSAAYIAPHEGVYYFAGGFNGGTRDGFMHMAQVITERINEDRDHGIIAVWHDESHINRYFIDFEPTIVLSPSYCFPEDKIGQYHPRILALVKDHNAYQRRRFFKI